MVMMMKFVSYFAMSSKSDLKAMCLLRRSNSNVIKLVLVPVIVSGI